MGEEMSETAKRILVEAGTPDEIDVFADIVMRAETILTTAAYRLNGERSPTPEQSRRLMNAVAAQWGDR